MGHTLIADVQTESLIVYGGYSLYFNILGDVWKYHTKTKNYVQETSGSKTPSPRYFHAADVYKVRFKSVFDKSIQIVQQTCYEISNEPIDIRLCHGCQMLGSQVTALPACDWS